MPSSEQLTPEEKLLQVIQGGNAAAAPEAQAEAAPAKPAVKPEAAPAKPAAKPEPPAAKLRLAAERPATPAEPPAGTRPVAPAVGAPAASAPAKETAKPPAPGGVTPPTPAPAAAPERVAPKVTSAPRKPVRITVAAVNRLLTVVVLVLLGLVAYSIAAIRTDTQKRLVGPAPGEGTPETLVPRAQPAPLPPLDEYLKQTADRNIFLPAGQQPASTNQVASEISKVTAGWKLMGVSVDATAAEDSMAIIRDKSNAKTYFLKRGQTVGDTGITLDRILGDRVILKHDKQELELR